MFGMLQRKELYMQNSTICPKCKGNGYITKIFQGDKQKPYHEDCKFCNNQGELKDISKLFDHERMQQ